MYIIILVVQTKILKINQKLTKYQNFNYNVLIYQNNSIIKLICNIKNKVQNIQISSLIE